MMFNNKLLTLLFFLRLTHVSAQGYPVNCEQSCQKINDECYQLTSDGGGQVGVLWGQAKVDITRSFQIDASVNLGSKDGDGADGMALVFQNIGNQIHGSLGGGLGYLGLSEYFAVELDTYQNDGEIVNDHIQVVSKLTGAWTYEQNVGNIETGEDLPFRVTWDSSTGWLGVYLGGSKIAPLLRFDATIPSISAQLPGNPDTAYFGFTAATGGLSNIHKVCIPAQELQVSRPILLLVVLKNEGSNLDTIYL
jgi:hypothetical protein